MPTDPPPSPLAASHPPEAWRPLVRVARLAQRPLERFLHIEAASGIVLLLGTALAFAWANSRWAELYEHLRHTPFGIRIGAFHFERDLEWIVNDGLMVIFFFFVGMEIRREFHRGELSEWRRATLPLAAALGGMLVPALLYLALAGQPPMRTGWGVPMATDIAFAIGILTLLGDRVPASLRVLLLALAVIDDLGAILVIAVFYASPGSLVGLLVAAAAVAAILLMQRFGVRAKLAYVLPAVVAWAGVLSAGVHPTIAGVVVGLLTPVRAWLGPEGFVAGVQRELDHLAPTLSSELPSRDLAARLRHVNLACREAMSPAESLIDTLHPWVAFGIMPLFALTNAGVALQGEFLDASSRTVAIAAAVGLVVGKPLGVLLASFVVLRLKIGVLPTGLTARHLVVLGLVAGVGFTMALFIAQLAFVEGPLLGAAKIGVLVASGLAAVSALVLGRTLPRPSTDVAAQTADDAEVAAVDGAHAHS